MGRNSSPASLKGEVVFGYAMYLFPYRPPRIGTCSQSPEDNGIVMFELSKLHRQ